MIGRYTNWMQKMPRPLGMACKWAMVYPRFWSQLKKARRGYKEYGETYAHPVLFIAGLPKSGTTWLERMVASVPGYSEVLLPSASFAELRGQAGHLYELPKDAFQRMSEALVLAKMHCPGSIGNVGVLEAASIPYVILYRDPRDVAVSYIHYVQNTPWHQDYPKVCRLELHDALRFFLIHRLPQFATWMRSWRDNRDQGCSLMLSYEEMLSDPKAALRRVFFLFRLEKGTVSVDEIVEAHRFENKQADGGSFLRKGISGDWKNYFDEELQEEFIRRAGTLLEEFGYEKDGVW